MSGCASLTGMTWMAIVILITFKLEFLFCKLGLVKPYVIAHLSTWRAVSKYDDVPVFHIKMHKKSSASG